MSPIQKIILLCLIALAVTGTAYAQNGDTDAEFWFLQPGTEPTPENRLNAIQSTGRGLLDFAVYQPTDATGKPLDAFPDAYRQKLLDAGYVFDFMTEEQLSKTTAEWATYQNSPVGRVSILVIPEAASLPAEEIQRLKFFRYAFLGKAPDMPESCVVKSLADLKNEMEAERKRTRDRLAASPSFAGKSDDEIDAALLRMPMGPPPGMPGYEMRSFSVLDQIGENLGEAVGLFRDRARAFPESFVAKTGVKLSARRALTPYETKDANAIDVLYVFANTQKDAKPVDGWFRLRELTYGRNMGHISFTDGRGYLVNAQTDRAFLMDPTTGKIGEAEVRYDRSNPPPEIRIQMKPGETLVVRVVRERPRGGNGPPAGAGFQEFESLPKWEYDETQR